MSKILRVNMTDLTTQFESVPEKYKTMGGRWLTSCMVCDEVPPPATPWVPTTRSSTPRGLSPAPLPLHQGASPLAASPL